MDDIVPCALLGRPVFKYREGRILARLAAERTGRKGSVGCVLTVYPAAEENG
jgi:hypothetical protein